MPDDCVRNRRRTLASMEFSIKPTVRNGEIVSTGANSSSSKQGVDDVFQIAEKAEKLLREIFNNKPNVSTSGQQQQQQQQQQHQINVQFQPQIQLVPYTQHHVQRHSISAYLPTPQPHVTSPYHHILHPYHQQPYGTQYQAYIQSPIHPSYYGHMQHQHTQPPLGQFNYQLNYTSPQRPMQHQQQLYTHHQNAGNYGTQYSNSNQPKPYSNAIQQQTSFQFNSQQQSQHQSHNYMPSKRKFSDMQATQSQTEDDDLNIRRERELKDLKCKSIVEKMLVFIKYYQQFKELYVQRIQSIECSDTLKAQFHSLIKYLNEYEDIITELDLMITQHEGDSCRNNHRKTKKFFNKTKAFIRYECSKRLQANIFEYRRQINSQDRFAGMYDLLDMNNYLISILPDIGVSIRRYINKCEKQKNTDEQEEDFDLDFDNANNEEASFLSENSNDNDDGTEQAHASGLLSNEKENTEDGLETKQQQAYNHKEPPRSFESFSKGVDTLNRYLLKRVENEESIDELVKERIIKWINKRQSKYILIFSEVDKLLNQHKDGECYTKFHSYLLFNLGKLVTVCESYHQKLKELLYSTTIKRKKKRKKVKLLPEFMSDVFDEIIELKRALEHTKLIIKKCNEYKHISTTASTTSQINNENENENETDNNDV